MPTMRIKVIWDRLFEEGEVERAFGYHRWRMIRDLMEIQGGLEMEDRHFYTGFVNESGARIKGRAAKWKMADWLIEKLDELVEFGFQEPANNEELPNLGLQVPPNNQTEVRSPLPSQQGGELCWNKLSIKSWKTSLTVPGSSNSVNQSHRWSG
jgi:hypothetical protein